MQEGTSVADRISHICALICLVSGSQDVNNYLRVYDNHNMERNQKFESQTHQFPIIVSIPMLSLRQTMSMS